MPHPRDHTENPKNPDANPEPNPDADPSPTTTPNSGDGSADEVIGDAPGAVGPMPFAEAASGIEDEPIEVEATPATESDRAQARAMLRMLLGAWNVLVPMSSRWWIRCQVFDEPQQVALAQVWEPYAVKYLKAVEPLYVALLATAGIMQANISAARDAGDHATTAEPADNPADDLAAAVTSQGTALEDMEYSGPDDVPGWPEENPTALL